MNYYTPAEITVGEHRVLHIGGFVRPNIGGVIVFVNGEERQYRNIQCMWDRAQGEWTIPTASYGTRTKAKKWTIRDSWHQADPRWTDGPIPPEVLKAGLQAILDQVKKEMRLLKSMQVSIEGDGPPRVPGTELEEN